MHSPNRQRLRSLGIGAVIAVGAAFGLFAPAALAAPPNDLFADRAAMPSTLPSEVEGSNVGATAEPEERVSETGRDGRHSIWWTWEAPITHLVYVDTCNQPFRANVGVFTGEEFAELHRVTSGEDPECGYPFTYLTFFAVAGTKYDIGVDGNIFYPDPAVHLTGEGQVRLQITLRPPPPNDAFESAAGWSYENIKEDADGSNRELRLGASGGTWGATHQPGEPAHAGLDGGASVWFRFTPTESGPALLGFNNNGSRSKAVVVVYTGESLTQLTPVATMIEPYAEQVGFFAEANRTYRIVVDGLRQADGTVWESDFSLGLVEKLANGPGRSKPPAPAPEPTPLAPPTLGKRSVDVAKRTATFRFSSSTAGARFRCKLDKKGFRSCSSPYKVGGLALGRHRLAIVTTAPGMSTSKPTIVRFALPSHHRRHHAAR